MLGFVVLLFLVLAGLVLRMVWGHLPGEMDMGEELFRGQLGKAERSERELPRHLFLIQASPHPPAWPLPHQLGLGCCQETAEA